MKNAAQTAIGEALSFASEELGREVTLEEVQARSRKREHVAARRLFCWQLRTGRRWSFPRIAKVLNRDHSTIMHLVGTHNLSIGKPANWPSYNWVEEAALRLKEYETEIIARQAEGVGLDTIADAYAVPVEHVAEILRRNGLNSRRDPAPSRLITFLDALEAERANV